MAVTGINDLAKDIEAIKEYTKTLLAKNEYSDLNRSNTSISGLASPQDYLSYVKLVQKQLQTNDGEMFLAKQGILKLMNPTFGAGKLYNPASALGPAPFAAGFTTDFLEGPLAAMNDGERAAIREDKIKALSDGRYNDFGRINTFDATTIVGAFKYPDGKTIQQKNDENNIFNSNETSQDYEYIDNIEFTLGGLSGRKTVNKNGVNYDVPDYEKLFLKKDHGPAFLNEEKGASFFKPKRETKNRVSSEVQAMRGWFEDDDTFMTEDDFKKGYLDTEQENVLEDQFYIPFYFEDFRKQRRYISFRAFLNNFSETLSPNWSSEQYFGRVDPVAQYKNTSRKINVTFKIVPKSAPGFSAAWRKINNLTKMVYPTFRNGQMVRAPMIRMRIGDVVCSANGAGLPGYIESLDFNYSDATWETSTFNGLADGPELGKAPMVIDVSLTYMVIHETNPSVDENYFMDFSKFRRVGAPHEDVVGANQPEDMTFTLEETNQNNTSTPEGAQ